MQPRTRRKSRTQSLQEKPAFIHTLPNELLTEIFLHYLPLYPEHPPLSGPGSPSCLVAVCRRWRDVGVHNPQLWRAMVAENDAEYSIAHRWLERSFASLLSLSLQFADAGVQVSEQPLSARAERFFEAVVAARSRWEYFYVQTFGYHVQRLFGPAPNLVDVEIFGVCDEYPAVTSVVSFIDVPRLHEAVFWDVNYDVASIPWDQLTSLSLLQANWDECGPVLEQCAALVSCKLILDDADYDDSPQLNIHLRHLEIFVLLLDPDGIDVESEQWGFVANTLRHFTLPALRRLEISDLFRGVDTLQLEDFVSRSQCKLQSLFITQHLERGTGLLYSCTDSEVFSGVDVRMGKSTLFDRDWWKDEDYWECWKAESESGDRDTDESNSESGFSDLTTLFSDPE